MWHSEFRSHINIICDAVRVTDAVVGTVASQQEGPTFNYIYFACSPHVRVPCRCPVSAGMGFSTPHGPAQGLTGRRWMSLNYCSW